MIVTLKQRDLRAVLRPMPAHERRAAIQMLREGHDPFAAVLVPQLVGAV